MTRRIAAVVWSQTGMRIAVASWRAGRLEDVAVWPREDAGGSAAPIDRDTLVGVVLSSTLAGRRIVTLPARARRVTEEVVALETRGSLPTDPGPLRVVWETLPDADAAATRVATVFAREATLTDVAERLASCGASALRIDAAPTPVWALVRDPRQAAMVVRDGDCTWVTAAGRDGRPLFARPLHADPEDPGALAAEVARSLDDWGVRPARLILAGPRAAAYGDALGDVCRLPGEPLAMPPTLGGRLADDPLLAGALLGVARRADLPLALVAPAPIPRRQRGRLLGLTAAAVVLAALWGTLARLELARRADALEAAIGTVAADALPQAAGAATYERLETLAAALPAGPTIDPAIVRLHELVSRLAPGVSLDLRHVRIDPDHVLLGGNVATFDAVETLRSALATSPRIVDVTIAEMRARIDGAGVEFRLEGRWLSPGERPS